ncbi:MAG: peptidylprolyl isomerase [Gemmatimonadota bacterium]
MRPFMIAVLLAWPVLASAQKSTLSHTDSTLVGRILLAEDRRDSTDRVLGEGAASSDPRIRILAQTARGRITDSLFKTRDSLPALPAPPVWPEPAWRLRYRALAAHRNDCAALLAALADSAWQVRLRAADLVPASCAGDDSLAAQFRSWIDALPPDASRRAPGDVSWHAAAHGIVALARLRPMDAHLRLDRLAKHRQWEVRMYAARASEVLADTGRLMELAYDADDNVKEAAIEALSRLAGHAGDDASLEALGARGAQAVRAAAMALKGSPRPDVPAATRSAFDQWVAADNAPARDARLALLDAAGRPASDDRPPLPSHDLPPRAVALALGAEVCLRVVMAPASGGGSFLVRLRGNVAPVMAARILDLARARYYDGLTWHRVEADFVIQGGSPGNNEYVGYPRYLRDELGTVPHLRGTVGMSTRGHDSGDAQWFVNLRDNLWLGPDYTVFGEVVEGIDVVDGVLEGDAMATIREASCRPR